MVINVSIFIGNFKKGERTGVAGVLIYIKDDISDGVEIVRNHFDSIIWLKMNKQYFGLDQDTYIAGVYIWGDNSPAYNVVDVDFFSLLQDDIKILMTFNP